ncbi:MAG: amidohydrolase family protein [Prevotellaceae bacterium]|jgi:cytosine/adenosine deaminase-related metal-dependent hydrolase|nr:amidohydrolase family protein [Prevotellaceae bacterium]
MHRIAAQYLFTGKAMIPRGVVTLDDTGLVLAIEQLADTETCSTEFYNGILTPGFVNAHCHLELSHYRDLLPMWRGEGLDKFIHIMKDWYLCTRLDENMYMLMQQADDEMYDEGIVAVGDICNTNYSFSLKTKSRLYYHSFVEMLGLDEKRVQGIIEGIGEVYDDALSLGLSASITPHALYSMNPALLDYAVDAANKSRILSLHYKEGENERNSSLVPFLNRLSRNTRLLLIHNTFVSNTDIEAVNDATEKAVWVLCPNSNDYISRSLPPAELLYRKGQRVAFGTDSLASNTLLSILDEMITLSQHFPQIPLEALLEWATLGGATALNKTDKFGLLIPGRRPGLVLIEGIDFTNMKLLTTVKARRI